MATEIKASSLSFSKVKTSTFGPKRNRSRRRITDVFPDPFSPVSRRMGFVGWMGFVA